MSKKIKISINGKRPNLSLLFHEYLKNKSSDKGFGIRVYSDDDYYDEIAAYWDKMFPGWDDDEDNCVVFPPRESGHKKGKHKHSRRGKKRGRVIDIDTPYSGYEENPTEIDDEYDDYDYQEKTIWFYPDYHYKDDRLEFNSLKSFDKYCTKMGYNVPNFVVSELAYLSESHCCLDPQAEKEGVLEIMVEHSYGEMFYEACDVSELG